jgi:16S rRNA processing protein RimM
MTSCYPSQPKYVAVARILRPRGNKGEVAAELLTDFPERLGERNRVWLAESSQEPRETGLVSFWMDRNHPGEGIFHLAGVASIGEAEKLRGLLIEIPFEQRAELPSGTYFVTDLIGCSVFEHPPPEAAFASPPCSAAKVPALVGQVRDVYFPGEGGPGTPLLALETPEGELLVPFAEEICRKVDLAARRIEVELPDGLRNLDR